MQNVIDWFISTRSAFERAFGLILNTITSRSVGAFGHTQVLKVSMGLAVFFLIHGALTVILDVNFGYRRSEVVPLLRHAVSSFSLVF